MKKAYHNNTNVYNTINLINFVEPVQIQAHNDYWREFYLQIKKLNLNQLFRNKLISKVLGYVTDLMLSKLE